MKTATSKIAPLPFPSTVTAPCQNEMIASLGREIIAGAIDTNNLFATGGNVHNFVRNHYVDTANGIYGIESLIVSILKEREAVFPKNVGETDFRAVAIQAGMLTSEIVAAIRAKFGADRYPDQTIFSYLSIFMFKNGKVGKIKMTNAEDSDRECNRPRFKWFLVQ